MTRQVTTVLVTGTDRRTKPKRGSHYYWQHTAFPYSPAHTGGCSVARQHTQKQTRSGNKEETGKAINYSPRGLCQLSEALIKLRPQEPDSRLPLQIGEIRWIKNTWMWCESPGDTHSGDPRLGRLWHITAFRQLHVLAGLASGSFWGQGDISLGGPWVTLALLEERLQSGDNVTWINFKTHWQTQTDKTTDLFLLVCLMCKCKINCNYIAISQNQQSDKVLYNWLLHIHPFRQPLIHQWQCRHHPQWPEWQGHEQSVFGDKSIRQK